MMSKDIDEILGDFDKWCMCIRDDCPLVMNFRQAKQALHTLLVEKLRLKHREGYEEVSGSSTDTKGNTTNYVKIITTPEEFARNELRTQTLEVLDNLFGGNNARE